MCRYNRQLQALSTSDSSEEEDLNNGRLEPGYDSYYDEKLCDEFENMYG